MSGDHTRFTFAPRRRFAAVLQQQGRVQLDSDWNEQADLLRERTRLLGLDAGGPAWLPALTTPDAFRIGALAGPPADLSIEPGRLYLDGRLAETFADEGVTYLAQPFLPVPPPLNPGIDTLVFLDLWEREVTWAQDTGLLDVALGGVDTTTRIQQVWQVRLWEQRGTPATCGTDLDALFPPSGGRLTSSAVAPPAPDDPCILPPVAGYRGIENRLYRIEVQSGGALGTARFSWSRDNGSIVARVGAIGIAGGQTRVTVNRIGRDAALRFRIDEWVTLTDDHREFHAEESERARIVDIDEAARIIVLDRALPGAGGRAFGADADEHAARNTRLQRWDQMAPRNAVDGDGLMTTSTGPIDLEDGVRVEFSTVAGGQFLLGDHWVFAARTADASVEELVQAPPRGIRHQYLQLAAIPAGGVPSDCRPRPAEDAGCCSFVLRPGEDIQAAIDALPDAGGCVCLKSGLHPVDRPLLIRRDNVTLHGESMGAIVFNRRGTGLLRVEAVLGIRIHTLVLRQGEAGAGAIAVVTGAQGMTIADCRFEGFGRAGATGIMAVSAEELAVESCGFAGLPFGVSLGRGCRDVRVADCSFDMAVPGGDQGESVAILATFMRGPLTATGNTIEGARDGIVVNDAPGGQPQSRADRSRIAGNRIGLPERPPRPAFGIDIAAPSAIVADNHIRHRGGAVTGIRLCGDFSSATGNTILCDTDDLGLSVAIVAGFAQDGQFLPVQGITIAGNNATGAQHGIALAGVARAALRGNMLGEGGVRFGLGVGLTASRDCIVAENVMARPTAGILSREGARNTYRGNRIDAGTDGILMTQEDSPAIDGNRISGMERLGIAILGATARCAMTENHVTRCGARSPLAIGIGAVQVQGEWHVVGNEVMDTGIAPGAAAPGAPLAYGIVGDRILEARIEGNLVTYAAEALRDPALEDRALRLRGALESSIQLGNQTLTVGFAAQISGNRFVGTGATALVELHEQVVSDLVRLRFERVLFSGNDCSHVSPPFNDAREDATVSLVGRRCTISGNQVKAGTPDFRSYHLHGMRGPFMGNVSHGPNWGRAPASEFPAPESAFNMIG